MSNSLAQTDYLTSLNDTITIDLSSLSLTTPTGYSSSTITIGGTGSTISSPVSFNQDWYQEVSQEWVNSFPEWSRIQDMCNTYPGLRIAFEKFRTTYHLVKDDYDNPTTDK